MNELRRKKVVQQTFLENICLNWGRNLKGKVNLKLYRNSHL